MDKYLMPFLPYLNIYEALVKDLDFSKKPQKFNPDELVRNHKVIPKNHKKFIIEKVEIYALNYKNALKKYNKLKIDKSEEDWEQYELNL